MLLPSLSPFLRLSALTGMLSRLRTYTRGERQLYISFYAGLMTAVFITVSSEINILNTMMMLLHGLFSSLGLCAFAGILSHLGFFIRAEHHLRGTVYARLACAVFITILSLQVHIYSLPFKQAFIDTSAIAAAYTIALVTSIIVYRIFFHPLRHFPGPTAMAVFKLAHAFRSRKLDNHIQMDQLQRTYGDFVRTGPNEITIFRPEAYMALHGPQSKCTKAAWYDVLKPNNSFHSTRVKSMHGKQKRVWDHAFSTKAIAGYESRVIKHTEMLEQVLSDTKGQPINMTDIIFFYVADVVGDIVCSTKFDQLRSGKKHFAADLLSAGFKPVGYLNPMPWLLVFLMAIPGVLGPWYRVVEWSRQEVEKRLKAEPENPDVLAWLLDANKRIHKTEQPLHALADDALLAVLAGSGTITPVLTFLVYRLALSPTHVAKIREELQTIDNIQSNQELQKLPHLNAVIYETMRVHSPVLDGLPRNTPAEGITINGQYIPGNVTCLAPFHTISKLPSCFEDPASFIPERWTTAPHLTKNKDAHMPFSLGPMGCVGKNLALMVLRLVTVSLVDRFDMEFPLGESTSRIVDESYNTVTNNPGPLRLVVRERGGL